MPILRSIAMLVALLLVIPAAHAQVPAPMQVPNEPVTYLDLTFPAEIGGARRISVRDYESSSPGLGYSAGYRYGTATSTVYIYDDRLPSIPDDLKSAVVRDQLEKAKADIERIPRNLIKEKSAFTINDASKRERFNCQRYALAAEPGPEAFDMFACLGVFKDKFLKVRTTILQTANTESEVRRFIGLWVDQLWSPSATAR
jgi:hypothetical protein